MKFNLKGYLTMYNLIDAENTYRKYFYLESMPEHLENTLRQINSQPNTIWVFDGVNSRAKRKILFPEYKDNRKKSISPDDLAMFKLMDEFEKVVLPSWGAVVLNFAGWEADDIIYNLVKFLNVSSVRSTDIDFWQMLKANAKLQLPDTNDCPCEPKDIILYKTLVGDSSDNIVGCKGFGKAAWSKLDEDDKEKLKNYFLSGAIGAVPELSCQKTQEKILLNLDQLRIFWKVISFIEIEEDDFSAMLRGKL